MDRQSSSVVGRIHSIARHVWVIKTVSIWVASVETASPIAATTSPVFSCIFGFGSLSLFGCLLGLRQSIDDVEDAEASEEEGKEGRNGTHDFLVAHPIQLRSYLYLCTPGIRLSEYGILHEISIIIEDLFWTCIVPSFGL